VHWWSFIAANGDFFAQQAHLLALQHCVLSRGETGN
jgi:hypothetical protein